MPVQTHKRPELRDSIKKLLDELVPAIRAGGTVPLTALVEAVVADKLDPGVRKKLESRKSISFKLEGGHAAFENEGPDAKIALKKFDIKIPKRLAGHARLVDGGAVLRFERDETLSAMKLFFSVKLETIEL